MHQTSTNIIPKYRYETHYNYVKNSGFIASDYSPLLCYRFVTTALTAQIPTETLSQSHRLCFMLLCYNHAKTTTFSAQSFTGKERDSETGYSYFGARYYDSDILTAWLSVDPMADKYPGVSPYAYCGWNPVKLVDPDGEEIINAYEKYKNNKQEIENLKERKKNAETRQERREIQRQINYAEYYYDKYLKVEKMLDDFKSTEPEDYNKLNKLIFFNLFIV